MKPLYPVQTDPTAKPEAMICVNDVRITVLFPRLIRVERSPEHTFTDAATQGVWFRNFPVPRYRCHVAGNAVTVQTQEVTYNIRCDDLENSTVSFGAGAPVPIYNKGVLPGTARTLDCFDATLHEKKDLGWGVMYGTNHVEMGGSVLSTEGVAVLDDSQSLRLALDGIFEPREQTKDIYIFAYEQDYRAALRAFYAITGAAPLIPRAALGNWWSRYHAYTQQSYLELMDKFQYLDIPLAVATVDMDWHYVDIKRHFGTGESGWTGYSWNKELFPDYKTFLAELHKRNLRVLVNLHPADGVRWFENAYPEFARRMGIDPESKKPIACDYTDPQFVKYYFELLHHGYEQDGVDYWWIDWQQGTESKVENLDPLWLSNHYHFYDISRNKQGMILSRYCGAGAHRYPLGFSGDTVCNWETFDYIPHFTAAASNIGFTWWSHDIGAHYFGYKDDELYLRWLQFGVFSPINRLHSSSSPVMGKEVWKYSKATELIATEYLRLRHKLLPYLYTYSHLTAEEGLALIEPMYYQHPYDAMAYQIRNQYYFGSELIVAPITVKAQESAVACRQIYLPQGVYQDIFSGYIYQGGEVITVARDAALIPVFAKQGAIIPLSLNKGNDISNPVEMEVWIFCGNGSFTMIEDDGGEKIAHTKFTVREDRDCLDFTVEVQGSNAVIPEQRSYVLNFKNIFRGEVVSVTADGQALPYTATSFDNLTVKISNPVFTIRVRKELSIMDVIEQPEDYIREKALEILNRLNGDNEEKATLYFALRSAATVQQMRQIVLESRLLAPQQAQLLELFYATKNR